MLPEAADSFSQRSERKRMAKNSVKYWVVDAFAGSAFKGNQAAVCLLEEDRDDHWLQSVASEFNLSETSFLTRPSDSESSSVSRFRLRWFTPVAEVTLCGHATLAAAHVLFTSEAIGSDAIEFATLSEVLIAKRVKESGDEVKKGFSIELDFPVDPHEEIDPAQRSSMSEALGGVPVIDMKRTTALNDIIVVVPSAKSVVGLRPDFDAIAKYQVRGVIVTGIASSESGFDFYSRFFAPTCGINEDPVTGSAHCSLGPYWQKQLGKHDFVAYQASARGGVLSVHLDEKNQRVLLRGKAVTVMQGTLLV